MSMEALLYHMVLFSGVILCQLYHLNHTWMKKSFGLSFKEGHSLSVKYEVIVS